MREGKWRRIVEERKEGEGCCVWEGVCVRERREKGVREGGRKEGRAVLVEAAVGQT